MARSADGESRLLFTSTLGDVTAVSVPGSVALERWHELRTSTAAWPVILGDPDSAAQVVDWATESEGDATHTIRAATGLAVVDLLDGWTADGAVDGEIVGDWPADAAPDVQFVGVHDEEGAPLESVVLATLPTGLGWQAAAVLQWGNWNACPSPEEHVALHHHWFGAFGAELVVASFDTLEFTVARPPTTRAAALDLATQQHLYCSDLVDQGLETISALAGLLLDSSHWFFWWD